jgi:hypothetical protein
MAPLTSHGQAAPVSQASVASEIQKPHDVHLNNPAKITLDLKLGVDKLENLHYLIVREVNNSPNEGNYALMAKN